MILLLVIHLDFCLRNTEIFSNEINNKKAYGLQVKVFN